MDETIASLPQGRMLVDLGFRDLHGLIGTYLLPEPEGYALVEVGPTSCREHLLAGLSRAGVEPRQVRDVLMTHIHLDHAGGAGSLAEDLPGATFHVHEVGLPHLLDPRRLNESARRAWGEAAHALWGPVVPLPAHRVHPLRGGEALPLASGGELRVLATPGHARHHLSFFDSTTRTIFTGDGAGILVPGARHIRPAVPPPDLDVTEMLQSLDAMGAMGPERIAFSHYGVYPDALARLKEAGEGVRRWEALALEAARRSPTVPSLVEAFTEEEHRRSREEGEDPGLLARAQAISALSLAAAGFLRYFRQQGLVPPEA
jgi:glyoxylase-like metal-dependent hydrolase (beta-lactamase superfamily II)